MLRIDNQSLSRIHQTRAVLQLLGQVSGLDRIAADQVYKWSLAFI